MDVSTQNSHLMRLTFAYRKSRYPPRHHTPPAPGSSSRRTAPCWTVVLWGSQAQSICTLPGFLVDVLSFVSLVASARKVPNAVSVLLMLAAANNFAEWGVSRNGSSRALPVNLRQASLNAGASALALVVAKPRAARHITSPTRKACPCCTHIRPPRRYVRAELNNAAVSAVLKHTTT